MTSQPEKTVTETAPKIIDFDTRMAIDDIPDGRTPFVNEELIEDLENLVRQARDGHIIAASWATVTHDKALKSGWNGAAHTKHSMMAAVMCLHKRVVEMFTGP